MKLTPALRLHLPAVLALLIGWCLSLGLFWVLKQQDEKNTLQQYYAAVGDRFTAIDQALTRFTDTTTIIANLFSVDQSLSYGTFLGFTGDLLRQQPSLRAINYAELIRPDELANFEQKNKSLLDESFKVWERQPNGQRAPQLSFRPHYASVIYTAPFDKAAWQTMGFDQLSRRDNQATFLQAQQTGETQLTPLLRLAPNNANQPIYGVLGVHAIYAGGTLPPTVQTRENGTRGFITTVLIPHRFVGDTLRNFTDDSGVSLKLYDISQPETILLYSTLADQTARPYAIKDTGKNWLWPNELPVVQRALRTAGRVWLLEAHPSPVATKISLPTLISSLIAASMSLMVSHFLYRRTRRLMHIENLVQQRTQELRESNAHLVKQIQLRSQAEARFQGIVEGMVDGMISINPRGEILLFNPAAERLFGYQQTDVLGKNIKMLMPEPYASLHDAFLQRYLATGQRRIIGIGREVMGLRQDGSTFPLWLGVSETHHNGQFYFIGIVQDISQRKAAESELREAKHMAERALQTKNNFLANVSHELRTPLNGILGMAQLLATTEQTAEQIGYTQTLHEEGEQLLKLINKLLGFEENRLASHSNAFTLLPIVQCCLADIEPRCRSQSVTTALEMAPDVPATLCGDDEHYTQVLTLLLDNAAKFTVSGHIIVRIKQLSARPLVLETCVIDTGIGIAPETLDDILTLETQGDSSRTRHFGGTGLGLALAKKLIQRLHGQLSAHSTAGVGSHFCFTAEFMAAQVESVMNVNQALSLFGGDESLLALNAQMFLHDAPAEWEALKQALIQHNVDTRQRACDALLDYVEMLAVPHLQQALQQLHDAKNPIEAQAAWEQTQQLLLPLQQELTAFLQTQKPR